MTQGGFRRSEGQKDRWGRLLMVSCVVGFVLGHAGGVAADEKQVCERGYIAELVFSSDRTHTAYDSMPRILIRADTTGFKPTPESNKIDDKYTEFGLRNFGGDEKEYQRKLTQIKAAFFSRTPVRLVSAYPICALWPDILTIEVCTSETDCNK